MRGVKNFTMNLETVGRVLLNAWRIAREELKSTNYDLQNMVYTVFNHRIPVFSDWTLTLMFDESLQRRAYVLDYMVQRVKFTENLLQSFETIPRSVEMTRLYGCNFESIV